VRDLLDSLYRGYPSGAILLWETDEAVPLQEFAVTQQKNPYQSTRLLLDGQQRLTSLSAVIRGEPVSVRSRQRPIEIPQLEELRQLVAGARARLADLEAGYTREKARVDVMQAELFRRLREHYQKRDRLRLIVDYRKRYLDLLLRGGDEEAQEAERAYHQARAQTDKEYNETATALAKRKELTAEDEAELTRLWKKLVNLYHPDRFAHQADKLATYDKLTSAINLAKDNGDIATLREIAEDPEGFIMRQGWESLDFGEERELQQLRRLYETLELEIVNVLESLNRLRESPDYELCQLAQSKPACSTSWRRSGRSCWKRKAPDSKSRQASSPSKSESCQGRPQPASRRPA
jgi:DNA polymerase-3 subunit epsilon